MLQEYHFELQDGDVIIAATDGLFDNLYEQEIASIVSKSVNAGMEPKVKYLHCCRLYLRVIG